MEWQRILQFWFGDTPVTGETLRARTRQWFGSDRTFDDEVRSRCEGTLHRAATGALWDWEGEPRSCLALILLFDQVPRNIYRGTARAFFFDPLASRIARDALGRGFDTHVSTIERAFVYLPLEHSEALDDQQQAVEGFAKLVEHAPAADRPVFEDYLRYAVAHQATIERFGRFPARNRALGRHNTPAEQEFLDAGYQFVGIEARR